MTARWEEAKQRVEGNWRQSRGRNWRRGWKLNRLEDEAKVLREIRQGVGGSWRRELEQKVSSEEEARMEQLQVVWRRQWEESMEKERKMQLEEDR